MPRSSVKLKLMSQSPLSNAELQDHLREQLAFLKASSDLFDKGDEYEAKRLATTIRVLVHDTKESRSLLELLSAKHAMSFWSVLISPPQPDAKGYMGIGLRLRSDGTSSYVQIIFPPQRKLDFDSWWEDEPLLIQGNERLTRKRCVLTLANKDGGAHIDAKLNQQDESLIKTDVMGWKSVKIVSPKMVHGEKHPMGIRGMQMEATVRHIGPGMIQERPSDLDSPTRAGARQIAHELLGSIREHFPQLFTTP